MLEGPVALPSRRPRPWVHGARHGTRHGARPLPQQERGLVLWQLGSATRREGASRSRDSFVNCPGDGGARARAILILRTAQSSSRRRYSTFRLDVMMISERRKSAGRAIDAPLTLGTRWTATTTFFGSGLARCDSFNPEPAATAEDRHLRRRDPLRWCPVQVKRISPKPGLPWFRTKECGCRCPLDIHREQSDYRAANGHSSFRNHHDVESEC